MKIAAAVFIIAVAVSLFSSPPIQSNGRTPLLIGTFQEKPIQTQEEVTDFLASLHPDVRIEKGESPSMVILTTKGQTSEEVKKELLRASSSTIAHHESMVNKKQTLLDEQINEQIKTLANDLTENNERIIIFNAMVRRLSPYDQAQALSLQAYLASYNNVLLLKDSLEKEIQNLEQQKKREYEKTKILTPPIISKNSAPASIAVSGIAGIILGLILGILWVFIKQWWDGNKHLLK